jgi:hypothetical protein
MNQMAAGWYPDPSGEDFEIYWDGERWHGRREKLSTAPPVKSDGAGSAVVVEGIAKLPTRKFWIAAITAIVVGLFVVFWVVPQVKESQEKEKWWDSKLNSVCMREKTGPPENLSSSDAMFACMAEGRW